MYNGRSPRPATSLGVHLYDADTFGIISDFVPVPVTCKKLNGKVASLSIASSKTDLISSCTSPSVQVARLQMNFSNQSK